LQSAEHLLFCKQFSIMCPSASRVSGPRSPLRTRGMRGRGSNLCQNLPWTGGGVNSIQFKSFIWAHYHQSIQNVTLQESWCVCVCERERVCVQNFIKIRAGVWISIRPPHANRQTDKQTSVRPFLYLYIRYKIRYKIDRL